MTDEAVTTAISHANALMDVGRNEEARQVVGKVLASTPENASLHRLLISACIKLQLHAEAYEVAQRLLVLEPDNPMSHRLYSVAVFRCGWEGLAVAPAEQSVSMDADDVNSLVWLSAVYGAVRRHDEARLVAERAVALSPEADDTRLQLCEVAMDSGRWPEARRIAKEVVATSPINDRAWASLGRTHLHYRRHVQAAKCYAKAGQLDPKNKAYTEVLFRLRRALIISTSLSFLFPAAGVTILLLRSVTFVRIHRALPRSLASAWSEPLMVVSRWGISAAALFAIWGVVSLLNESPASHESDAVPFWAVVAAITTPAAIWLWVKRLWAK